MVASPFHGDTQATMLVAKPYRRCSLGGDRSKPKPLSSVARFSIRKRRKTRHARLRRLRKAKKQCHKNLISPPGQRSEVKLFLKTASRRIIYARTVCLR